MPPWSMSQIAVFGPLIVITVVALKLYFFG
jgi:hypothetical protein